MMIFETEDSPRHTVELRIEINVYGVATVWAGGQPLLHLRPDGTYLRVRDESGRLKSKGFMVDSLGRILESADE